MFLLYSDGMVSEILYMNGLTDNYKAVSGKITKNTASGKEKSGKEKSILFFLDLFLFSRL